jgi:hypothetical protein
MSEQHIADMKRCSKCQAVYYCSRQCQEWDWRVGGHRLYCKKVLDGNPSGAPINLAAASGAVGAGISGTGATASNGVTAGITATLSAGTAPGGTIKELN